MFLVFQGRLWRLVRRETAVMDSLSERNPVMICDMTKAYLDLQASPRDILRMRFRICLGRSLDVENLGK